MLNLEQVLRNKRILILDDLVEARSAMKKMMTLLGAKSIDIATTGNEASSMIMNNDYDIILADYNLGKGKDGQQVLEEARFTNRLKASSLFIMVTGENALDMVMGALEYEPDNYITKPFTLAMLRERLIRIMTVKIAMAEVDRAIDYGELDKAINIAREKLAASARMAMPLTRVLGKLLMRQKRYDEALDVYTKLLEKRSVSWARLGQALCIYHQGDARSALALIEQCLLAHPRYVQCHDSIAKILLSMGDKKGAQEHLQKAVEISPRAVLRQMELGRVAFDNQDYPVAEMAFEQAIRLGRYSCHKDSDNYLKFAMTARNTLEKSDNVNTRELRQLTDKAFKLLDELREDYAEDADVMFDTAIVEGKTYTTLNDTKRALESASTAELLLQQIKQPNVERQLQMAEAYIDTQQHTKAHNVLTRLKKSDAANPEFMQRIHSMESTVNQIAIRERTASLNSQGIDCYTQKKYEQAVTIFEEAAGDEEASVSVLMNAIQAKISLMENRKIDKRHLKDCQMYFKRIGDIAESDERFERFSRLRKTFDDLVTKVN